MFRLYQQEKAHIHHHRVILCSFAWVAFAVGVHDHCKKGKNADGTPCRHKSKNTKPCNAYDGTKYTRELYKGNTILKKYGDPQTQIFHFGGYIADIYEDARLINVAVGEPRLGNVNQIHDEILKKLESMADGRRQDTKISGNPIPYCCELETLQQMYTAEELQTAGVTTTLSIPTNHTNVKPAGSELEESDITDYEGHREVTEESTDTELFQQTHTTMMITSDQEKHWLEALTREQDRTCNKAVKQVQTRHLREMEATADIPCHSFKWRSASREGDSKQTREESPEYGTTPQERGRRVFNEWTSIKQTRFRPHQVKDVWDPRVTHPANMPAHHTTIPRVYTICPADAALTAGTTAVAPHLTVTSLVIITLHPRNSQWTPNQDQHNQLQHSPPHRRRQN